MRCFRRSRRACAVRTRSRLAADCAGLSGQGLARTGRGHLGGARRAAALRSLEGHGLGRLRSRRSELEARAFDDFGRRWREIADEIHAEVCERGFDRDLNSFVQAYGSKRLDASLLLIPLVGFLPATDSRVHGTLRAIEKKLLIDGEFVLRYETDNVGDGLPAGEGAFLACSFWLVDNYVLQGRRPKRGRFLRVWSRAATTWGCSRKNSIPSPAACWEIFRRPTAMSV